MTAPHHPATSVLDATLALLDAGELFERAEPEIDATADAYRARIEAQRVAYWKKRDGELGR